VITHLPAPYSPAFLTRGDGSFTRGFVASACLSAVYGSASGLPTQAGLKRMLRHGLQGGAALTAGSRAACALRHGDYSSALIAAAAGTAAVLLIENLLRDTARPSEDGHHGQET
jgi:hypothetical protein